MVYIHPLAEWKPGSGFILSTRQPIENTPVRIAFISDLHFDHNAGLLPVLADRLRSAPVDALVLGGDLFSGFSRLATTLKRLNEVVPRVLYLPGNHDLWVTDTNGLLDSRQLYEAVLPRVVHHSGAHYLGLSPVYDGPVAIVGVTGWYEDFPGGQLTTPDAVCCVWPGFEKPKEVLEWQLELLEQQLEEASSRADRIFVVTHTASFVRLITPSIHEDLWPYVGSDRLGDLIYRYPKVVYTTSGHVHARFLFSVLPRSLPWEISPFGYPGELGKDPRETMLVSLRIIEI